MAFSLPEPGWRAGTSLRSWPFSQSIQSGHQDPACSLALASRVRPGPVLILRLRRRIDHPGDMAGPGQNEAHRPAEELAAEIDRLGRRDVVLTCGEVVDRRLDLVQVERG